MTLVVWLAPAREDLREIVTYIGRDNPPAARRVKRLLEASVLPVAEHPYLYRQSERVPGLREISAHPNYLVLYRITGTRIEVVNVLHARQEYPLD